MENKIKAVIYGDTSEFQLFIMRNSKECNSIDFVGHSSKYENIIKIIELLLPDVIIAEIKEPVENGISIIQKLKTENYGIPIVAVIPSTADAHFFKLSGINEIVKKPKCINPCNEIALFDEIVKSSISASAQKCCSNKAECELHKEEIKASKKIIAIGASMGGTDAITRVLYDLPENTPGIVIAQHMPGGFTRLFASRLNSACKMKAKEARDGEIVQTGIIYVAPGGMQTQVNKKGGKYILSCKCSEKAKGHSPSADVLFSSVANSAGENALGIILTGMGEDGAKGLLEMRKNGARTIGQDNKSSIVYGMPEAAFKIGAVEKQLPVDKIGEEIVDIFI